MTREDSIKSLIKDLDNFLNKLEYTYKEHPNENNDLNSVLVTVYIKMVKDILKSDLRKD